MLYIPRVKPLIDQQRDEIHRRWNQDLHYAALDYDRKQAQINDCYMREIFELEKDAADVLEAQESIS